MLNCHVIVNLGFLKFLMRLINYNEVMVLVNLSFLRVHFLGTLPMFALTILLILFEQSKGCCLHIVIKKFEMGKY